MLREACVCGAWCGAWMAWGKKRVSEAAGCLSVIGVRVMGMWNVLCGEHHDEHHGIGGLTSNLVRACRFGGGAVTSV